MAAKPGKRAWQPREMQMLGEWLIKNYGTTPYQTRVRLGSLMPSKPRAEMTIEERAMVGVWRRWADALILEKDKTIIVEAAIRPDPGKISQLELYAMLLPHTIELENRKDLPIEKLLLYAIPDEATLTLARRHGIRTVQYRPPWLDDYLKVLMPRERRSPRTGAF